MAELTKLTGTYIRSGSIPTTALSGGVVSSSLQVVSALPGNTVSSSAQVTALLPTDTVSSSAQVKSFLPNGTVSASSQYPGWVTASSQIDYGQLQNIPSGIASSSAQVKAYLPIDTVSSSVQVDITNTTNYTTFSSSLATVDAGQNSRLSAIESTTGSYATTGSNTFVAAQTISDSTNSTSYLDGALHIVGGMSVRKDVRVSGSMTINGLLTAVSMSTQYVTSSEYNIGVSKITLNDDDNVRFSGLSIVDSGSASPTTASIFWDSLQHRFIYENLSGSSYNSSIIIAGPKHTGSLGDEPTLTSGYVPYATGGDHIDNSVMYQSGSNIGIGTTNPAAKLDVRGAVYTSTTSWGYPTELVGTLTRGGTGLADLHIAQPNGAFRVLNSPYNSALFVVNEVGTFYSSGSAAIAINIGTGDAYLSIGEGRNANGYAYLDLVGDTTYTDYGLRIIRNNGGVNTSSEILHRGTGQFNITTLEAAGLQLGTSNTARLNILSNGNVGIGTTDPAGYRLNVIGGATRIASYLSFGDNGYIRGDSSGWLQLQGGSTGTRIMESSNTAARVTVLDGGNVGIGTTSPTYKVSTQGTGDHRIYHYNSGTTTSDNAIIQAEVAGDNSGNAFFCAGKTGLVWSLGRNTSTGNFEIRSNFNLANDASSRMIIKTDGNVGIGTTNPSAKLQIAGSSNSCVFDADSTTFTGRYALLPGRFVVGTVDNGYPQIGYNFTTSNSVTTKIVNDTAWRITFGINNRMDFGYAGGGTGTFTFTEAMSIKNDGNVGIGTITPGYKLHVNGDIVNTTSVGSTGDAGIQLGNGHRLGFDQAGTRSWTVKATGGNLQFFSGDNSGYHIFSSAGVGIGTTSFGTSAAKLAVGPLINGSSSAIAQFDGFIRLRDTILLHSANSDAANISYDTTGLKLTTSGEGASGRIIALMGGNVGIGTTNPGSYKLQVQGDTYVTGTLTEGSSIALKKNINPITDALNIINNLTGYTFDRTDSDATNQAGLIAEEVAEVLPGVVSLDQDGNPSGVQYTKIIAYLVESIKELKSELDVLKRQ